MNGVDHVEPHTAIPGADRAGCRRCRDSARHIRRCRDYVAAVRDCGRDRRGPALETITGELRSGTDYANLLPGVLSARVYLKQQNAQVQTLLESYAEPLSRDRASRSAPPSRTSSAGLQACLYVPRRRTPPRLEDAAAEPPARQHLRLQHRCGPRGEHDAVCARRAGRRRGRRARARCDRRCGARAIHPPA